MHHKNQFDERAEALDEKKQKGKISDTIAIT